MPSARPAGGIAMNTAERVGMDADERLVLVMHAGARFMLDPDGSRDRYKADIWQRVRDYTST